MHISNKISAIPFIINHPFDNKSIFTYLHIYTFNIHYNLYRR